MLFDFGEFLRSRRYFQNEGDGANFERSRSTFYDQGYFLSDRRHLLSRLLFFRE